MLKENDYMLALRKVYKYISKIIIYRFLFPHYTADMMEMTMTMTMTKLEKSPSFRREDLHFQTTNGTKKIKLKFETLN